MPAALPLPLHRPAARGAVRPGRARHAGAPCPGDPLRPAGTGTHARRRRGARRAGLRGARARRPRFRRHDAHRPRGLASRSTRHRCSRPTSPWRTPPASSRTPARWACPPSWRSRSRCGGSSTGSTASPAGEIRIVDYKTGRSPGAGFEAKAMFQMRFYALAWWRMTGEVPRRLQLMYLGNGEVLQARAGRGGPAVHRAQGAGPAGRHRAGGGRGDVRPVPVEALRLVQPPGRLSRPGVALPLRCPTAMTGRPAAHASASTRRPRSRERARSDSREVNRRHWDERAPAHAASPDYGVARFAEDPDASE